jgi:hypothetical protein
VVVGSLQALPPDQVDLLALGLGPVGELLPMKNRMYGVTSIAPSPQTTLTVGYPS